MHQFIDLAPGNVPLVASGGQSLLLLPLSRATGSSAETRVHFPQGSFGLCAHIAITRPGKHMSNTGPEILVLLLGAQTPEAPELANGRLSLGKHPKINTRDVSPVTFSS